MTGRQAFLVVGLAVVMAAMPAAAQLTSWSTAGGNAQRTSYVAEQVTGTLTCRWLQPIEGYIPQFVQLVAANNHIFVATSRGLIVLRADTGALAWRYNTELPITQTPTLDQVGSDIFVYFSSADRKVHCLRDNGTSYTHMWAFEGGSAFYTSPLVAGGRVFAGNRDGKMYAIWAQGGGGTAGTAAWTAFQTGGPCLHSPAYYNGVIYFGSNDCYAYAVNASTGAQVWKSAQLPTAGFHSWWPVIWGNYVIFTGAFNYGGDSGTALGNHQDVEPNDMWYQDPDGGDLGTRGTVAGPWASGTATMDMTAICRHYEADPTPDGPALAKPWRRMYFILAQSNGAEYTMDLDSDTYPEYAPYDPTTTMTGGCYPPVVGSDGVAYGMQMYTRSETNIARAIVSGWKIGTPYMSLVGGDAAIDEPMALSVGGSRIYSNLCCARRAESYDYTNPGAQTTNYWGYGLLENQLNYWDAMWYSVEGYDFYEGLQGMYGSLNGVYNDHGDQSPIVPYSGKIYMHRRNCILAYDSSGTATDAPSPIAVQSATDTVTARSATTLKAILATEIGKFVSPAIDLKPGYIPQGQAVASTAGNNALGKYFKTPGETFAVLSSAYPHLTGTTQSNLASYLSSQYTSRGPLSVTEYGWNDSDFTTVHRTNHPIPNDQVSRLSSQDTTVISTAILPPENIYGVYRYALVTGNYLTAYNAIKGRLAVPCPLSDDALIWGTWDLNRYIAGYYGYLLLEAKAGQLMTASVANELDRLLDIWVNDITKDSPFSVEEGFIGGFTLKTRHLNVCRPFIWMTPELGAYLHDNAFGTVQDMVDEYNSITPGWFIARYEGSQAEGAYQHLMDRQMFLAKAYALRESTTQLDKYLDVPYFAVGDLAYIQHLVALIEAIEGVTDTAPIARADVYNDVYQSTPYVVAAPGVLANDVDTEVQPLTAGNLVGPSHGSVSLNANGGFTYTPTAGYTGSDSFTYKASDGSLQSATTTVNLSVNPSGPLWTDTDIGSVGLAGSYTSSNGVFAVDGGGADIYGTADAFHYVYRPINASDTVSIVARVWNISNVGTGNPNNLSRGGVMIRQDLTAGSKEAMVGIFYNATSGARWQYRATANSTTAKSDSANKPFPYWVRLDRNGSTNQFTAYTAPDQQPLVWTQIGSPQTITMTGTVYIGLAVTAKDNTKLTRTVFDNVSAPVSSGSGNPQVSVTLTDSTAAEPSDDGQFTITRTGSTAAALSVNVAMSGTATNGSDYQNIASPVTIPIGQSSATVLVDMINDSSVEGTETCVLTVNTGSGYDVGSPSSQSLNITDDDSPVVTVTASIASASEPSTDGQFTVTRTGSTSGSLVVNVGVSGTATNGTDYTSIGSTVTIPNGQASVTVPVDVTDDGSAEGSETCILTVNSGSGYTVGTPSYDTVTIADNDLPVVTVVATDSSAAEPTPDNDGTFTVSRTGPTTAALVVNIGMSGSATNGTDYQNIGSTVTIAIGQSSATVAVDVIDDGGVEGNETCVLTVNTGSGYTVGTPSNDTVTIADNDQPTVTVTASIASASEPSTDGQFTVTRTGSTSGQLVVNVAITGTATNGTDYTSIGSTVTIQSGQASVTVPVDVTDDGSSEGSETCILTVNSGSGYSVGTPSNDTVTIADNDSGTPQTLYTTADTFTLLSSPDNNYGSSTSVQLRYTAGAVQRQSYLYFDLSGVNSTINGATLRLYQSGLTSTSLTFDVYVAAASWVENTVTWNNKPATSGSSIGNQVSRTTAQGAGWVEVTLTASAIDTLRTGNNYGLVIIPRSGGSTNTATFDSREASPGNDAELVVTP